MGEMVKVRLVVALTILFAAVAGCGTGANSAVTATVKQQARNNPLRAYPKGPTRQFIVPGGDNSVPLYGHEATKGERAQASVVLEKWMQAREARNFTRECTYFARKYVKALVVDDAQQVSEGKVRTCPQALAYFGSKASGDFKNTLTGPIGSLRVSGDEGYAQYHGNGADYEIPMKREGRRWLVSLAAPISR
jgi:hypothetical protein